MANITGRELADKILKGERDFRKIRLPDNTNLIALIPDLNNYLKGQKLKSNPLDFSNSTLIGIIAPKIHIPFVNMSDADMPWAHMPWAYMYKAVMSRAHMPWAHMPWADMSEAKMYKAHIPFADIYRVDMSDADMRGVVGLKTVLNLNEAHFLRTIVTKKEKKIIEAALNNRELFDVRTE